MGQTIISAIGVYISTSIDYLVILIILFAQLSPSIVFVVSKIVTDKTSIKEPSEVRELI